MQPNFFLLKKQLMTMQIAIKSTNEEENYPMGTDEYPPYQHKHFASQNEHGVLTIYFLDQYDPHYHNRDVEGFNN
jgi:hypothetical protein